MYAKLETFGLQLIRDIVQVKMSHRIYELEQLDIDIKKNLQQKI